MSLVLSVLLAWQSIAVWPAGMLLSPCPAEAVQFACDTEPHGRKNHCQPELLDEGSSSHARSVDESELRSYAPPPHLKDEQ